MTFDKEIIISIFNSEKEHFVKLPSSLVTECMNYLNGKLVSAELMSEIKNLKDQDPTLSKTEIVEYILDHQERILRSLNKK
jgi:hypothetical protein